MVPPEFFTSYKSLAGARGRAGMNAMLLPCLILILVLALMSGCAARKEEPETAAEPEPAPEVEIAPEQKRIAAWYKLMREERNAPEMEKLEKVNSFFNQLEFLDDRILWGREDYWATPRQMLLKNGGDCEDFATAKYFTLRQLEVPDNRMRLTYVKVVGLKKPHMVLSYYMEPSADPLVLDILMNAIRPASERKDLVSIYSFNGQNLWLARKEISIPLGRSERLNPWRDLQIRFIREAIAAPFPPPIFSGVE